MLALAGWSGGCGGGSSDEATVKSQTQAFLSALADKDGSMICDLLTSEVKRQLLKTRAAVGTAGDCTATISKVLARYSVRSERDALRAAKVKSVKVNGDTATVTVTYHGDRPLHLQKTGGQWLISTNFGSPPPTLNQASTQTSVADVFKQAGHPTSDVSCPDNVPAQKGRVFTCTVTLHDGQTFKARAVQTDNNGHFQVSLPNP